MNENLPDEKKEDITEIFWETGQIRILRSTLLKTELFCLNSFLVHMEEQRGATTKTGK
jgi:hypothetical protein